MLQKVGTRAIHEWDRFITSVSQKACTSHADPLDGELPLVVETRAEASLIDRQPELSAFVRRCLARCPGPWTSVGVIGRAAMRSISTMLTLRSMDASIYLGSMQTIASHMEAKTRDLEGTDNVHLTAIWIKTRRHREKMRNYAILACEESNVVVLHESLNSFLDMNRGDFADYA